MKRIKLNGYKLEMYDSIDEMPVTRFQEYNRFLMIDSGIGADADAVSQHIARLQRYIGSGDKDNAIKELSNFQQSLLFIIENTNPEFNVFAALIAAVNEKPFNDLSEDSVKDLMSKLSRDGLTVGVVRKFLDYVKKKLT